MKLQSLALTITSPATGQDFTFLEGVQFFVEADGLEKRKVARGGPFAQGPTTVSLMVLDVDLAPYATAPSMTFTTTARGQKPQNTTTIEAKIILDVDVNVGGLICGTKG